MIPKNVRPGATAEGLSGDKVSFQIEANGKAFRTLIDGLYSNKVRAVIRELSSNARDSHIEAGVDRPFEVYIPTNLDPTFRVRDYGVSLTHDGVMSLYTTIFRSTKESTNDQTGQLGLGSKSPFAYTDTFSVIAYLDGVRRVYIAYLETDGVPCITHVGDEPTDEPQGLEVSFPAKREDLRTFQHEMKYVLMGYPQGTIEVIGADAKLPEPLLTGDDWEVVDSREVFGNYHGQRFVRMGSVVYPVDGFRPTHLNQELSLIVNIPIGAADVTASREALSMDDETRDTIDKAVRQADAEIRAQVEELVKAASDGSRHEVARAYLKYGHIVPAFSGRTRVSLTKDESQYLRHDHDRTPGDILEHAQYFNRSQNIRNTRVTRYISHVEVRDIENFVLIIDDPTVKLVRRSKRLNEFGKKNRFAYVFSSADPKERRKARKWVQECLGLSDDQIKVTSDIPDCPPPPRASNGPRKGPRRLAPGQYWMPRYDGCVKSPIYGTGDRGTANNPKWPWTMRQAADAVKISLDASNVFFVNRRDQQSMEDKGLLPESRRLDVVIQKKVLAEAKTKPIEEALIVTTVTREVGHYSRALPVVMEEFFSNVTMDFSAASEVLEFVKISGMDLQNSPITASVKQKVARLADEYPLLFNRSDRKHYEAYVKAIKTADKP